MKKSELNTHAEILAKTYEETHKVWAALGLLYASLDKPEEKTPPRWMMLETIKECSLKIGDIGMNLAEFLDAHQESKGSKK
jgi:hypothetical protein